MDGNQQEPKVSIIVPVRNAERTIEKTLEYLASIDYPPERMEIVLADGGSSDGTVASIRRWQAEHSNIKLIQVPNCQSPGHARNEALKLAGGEFVLFTDGDCAPNRDWVQQMLLPFFRDPAIGGVGGEVLTMRTETDNPTEAYCEQVGFLSVSGRCGVVESGYLPAPTERAPHEVSGGSESPFFATANAAFRKEAIAAAGGAFWDEPTGEDVDFSLRVQAQGYRLFFAREAVVRHMHRVALDSFLRQWYGYGFGHPLLLTKHADARLELVIQTGRPIFFKIRSARKGIVHIGSFHLMHVLAGTTALAGIVALLTPAAAIPLAVSVALWAAIVASYFWPCRRLHPEEKLLTWCKIRYLSNWAFVRGALAGSRRFGSLCIEPSW